MSAERATVLELSGVRFGYGDRTSAGTSPFSLGPVTLTVCAGQSWAIVGANGAGKSTLLRLMAGLCRSSGGTVALFGTALGDLSPRERAKSIAFVPQRPRCDVDVTAREAVLLGRYPHRSLGLFDSAEDFLVADETLVDTRMSAYADRAMSTLSGGEAQRVHVAAALAQQPKLLLLDEPTASLDLQHQLGIFEILRDRTSRGELAVVVVTHDVNLAARFCSQVLLHDHGRMVAAGPPEEVVTPDVLGPIYGVELAALTSPSGGDQPWIVPVGVAKGNGR